MARTPSRWYRAERDEWRVICRGIDHHLGHHPQGYPAPRKQRKRWNLPRPVLDRFHELMAAKPDTTAPAPPVEVRVAVADVFEKFIGWCRNNRSPRAYEWSRNHIQSFVNALKARKIVPPEFAAEDLRPFHVNEWVDAQGRLAQAPGVGAEPLSWRYRRRPAGIHLGREAGAHHQIAIRHIEKPPPRRREQVLTQADFDALLANVSDERFRDVLEFCWETGCRV